ncbi:MAG: 1,4-alpha-glucan branching protein domain-containing protein [Candidatus Kapaibacterium sp.]
MHSGNFVLILHTHLPWVLHHGVSPHGVDWLNEAVAECYIPLLNVFNDLNADGIPPKVTLDISPVLCEQLEHEDFKEIFVKYCDEKIAAARRDEQDFKSWGYDPHHIYLTQFWADWYQQRKNDFIRRYDRSVIRGLRELQDAGAIEIMTCGATHGYFPLLGYDKSVRLQAGLAVENYKKHFGREPRGIWLPECAYRPSYEWQSLIPVAPFNRKHLRRGVEQILAEFGIEFFVIDQFLIENSYPIGKFTDQSKENFVPVNSDKFESEPWNFDKSPLRIFEISSSEKTEYGTAAAFTRHHDISMQVWSGEIGYPGEPDYLDFHKKNLGSMIRYWRVTDNKADMMHKQLYHPDWIWKKLDMQSNHFIHHMENAVNHYHNITGKFATMSTPFDTELFGHWWFEGPEFLRMVIRGLHNSPYINTATASEQMLTVKPREVIGIPEGSWGVNNNHDVWSNSENVWTWEAIYNDELRLNNLLAKYPTAGMDSMMRRICTQAMREMLLMMASDWQFLIYTESARDYAEQRFSYHHSDFNKLCTLAEEYAESGNIDGHKTQYLEKTERANPVFPELELEWWHD